MERKWSHGEWKKRNNSLVMIMGYVERKKKNYWLVLIITLLKKIMRKMIRRQDLIRIK